MVVGEKGEEGHHTIICDVTSIKAKISLSISRILKILENWKFTTFTTQDICCIVTRVVLTCRYDSSPLPCVTVLAPTNLKHSLLPP